MHANITVVDTFPFMGSIKVGIPCKIPPWNSIEFHGIRWNIFHGIPWSIRTWISMEFHGVFSRELAFHGVPWNSMEKEYQDEFH